MKTLVSKANIVKASYKGKVVTNESRDPFATNNNKSLRK